MGWGGLSGDRVRKYHRQQVAEFIRMPAAEFQAVESGHSKQENGQPQQARELFLPAIRNQREKRDAAGEDFCRGQEGHRDNCETSLVDNRMPGS